MTRDIGVFVGHIAGADSVIAIGNLQRITTYRAAPYQQDR